MTKVVIIPKSEKINPFFQNKLVVIPPGVLGMYSDRQLGTSESSEFEQIQVKVSMGLFQNRITGGGGERGLINVMLCWVTERAGISENKCAV